MSGGWSRLDPLKLLLDPVKVLGQLALPAGLTLVGIGSGSGRDVPWWLVPPVVLGALALGTLPWLTTWWRISDTQFQLRSGVLNRTTSTAPLDRIRSVDLEASLLHRVLGLAKVQIGTGVDDDRITLDAMSRRHAEELRTTLGALRRQPPAPATAPAAPTSAPAAPDDHAAGPVVTADRSEELARIDWAWLRFAPFSLARLVLVAGVVGVFSQVAGDLPFLGRESLAAGWEQVRQVAVVLLVTVVLVAALAAWLLVSVTGYVVQWWGMRLTRSQGSLHLTAGLLTTRSISVEEARVRGVRRTEPLLLRLVRGAELDTLATGVGSGGVTSVLPPCPRDVTGRVGDHVLGRPGMLDLPLHRHGPAARRRCHVRAAWPALALVLVTVVATLLLDLSGWLPVAVGAVALPLAAAVAEAAYSHLGHALAPEHLVAGSGALSRVRTVLETDGIIGWVLRQGIFQRRLGLATLVATTAAGSERVVVHDVPRERALSLAHAATPGMLDEFLALPVAPASGPATPDR